MSCSCLSEDCGACDARHGCVFCVHLPPVELSVRSGNPKLQALKKMSLTALHQALKNATTMNSNFAMRNSAMMRTTKTKYAAGFPDQHRSHTLHFLRIADSDFDAFVCSDELVCRTASFSPHTRLVVADILVRHCNLLFAIVLFSMPVLHKVFLSCLSHRMRELQTNLRLSFCSSVL